MGGNISTTVHKVKNTTIDPSALKYLTSLDYDEYSNVFALKVTKLQSDDSEVTHNVYYHVNDSDDFMVCHLANTSENRGSAGPFMYYVPTAGDTYCIICMSPPTEHVYVVNLSDVTRVAKCHGPLMPLETLIESADYALKKHLEYTSDDDQI